MAHDELTIDLRTVDGSDILLFKLRGSLDLATAPTVRAALTDAAEEEGHDVIVDLTSLEFLDSTGLGVLIGAHRRAAERGGSFRLVVSDGPIARLLNITGLMTATSTLEAKKFGLLCEMLPNARVIAMLTNPNYPPNAGDAAEVQSTAQTIGRQLLVLKADSPLTYRSSSTCHRFRQPR